MTSYNSAKLDRPSKKNLLFVAFSLCIVTFSLYWQALNHEFVYDDIWYIIENPTVSQGLSLKGVRWAFVLSEKENTYYHPLSWLSHMLDVEIYGLAPVGHHLSNIILHCLNTIVLFWIFFSLTRKTLASVIVALLFAIHPINIETVAWVAERKNLLSAFFGFCAILAYKRYSEVLNLKSYLVVCFLFVLGLLAKPALVILPLLLLLLDFWPLARLQVGNNDVRMFMRLVLEKIPLFILSAASVLVASASLDLYGNLKPVSKVPLLVRMANALCASVKYIYKLIFPVGQSVLYPFPSSVPVANWSVALIFLVFVSFLCVKNAKKKPYYFLGWFWFLIALLPVSGLLQAGLWPSMADRWAYFPAIGIFIIIAWTAEKIYRQAGKLMRISFSTLGVIVLILFITITYNQIKTWQNSFSLFQQAIIHAPDHYVVNLNYANALFDNGRIEEAIKYYRKAISLDPGSFKAHRNLANALMKQSDYEQAILHYKKALDLLPGKDASASRTHFALGNAYESLHDLRNASVEFFKAIEMDSNFVEAYNRLGIILADMGRVEEAVALFQKALQLRPDDEIMRQNLNYAQKILQNQ